MSEQPSHRQKTADPPSSSTGEEEPGRQILNASVEAAVDAASLDLTRYKTRELEQRFKKLFGVVHLLPWAGAGLGACIFASLLTWGLLFAPRASLVIASLTLIYMSLQGFFLGVLAAGLLVISRILQQLTAIVDLTIQTLRELFRDIRQLTDPRARAELAGAVIHGAIIPSVQSVIAVKLGLLRFPISFVVNRVLGKTAKKLTKRLEKDDQLLEPVPEEEATDGSPSDPVDLQQSSPTALAAPGESHLDRMQDRVELIARRTRQATLIPATLFFVVAASVSSIPWLLTFFAIL